VRKTIGNLNGVCGHYKQARKIGEERVDEGSDRVMAHVLPERVETARTVKSGRVTHDENNR